MKPLTAELVEALEKLLPLAIDDSPGGCDGSQSHCSNCEAIRHANVLLLRARSEDADGWGTMESAPKDGTHILVCRGSYNEYWTFNQSPPAVVHYWSHPAANEDGFYFSSGGTDDDLPFEFTHWRPLPAPPVEEKG